MLVSLQSWSICSVKFQLLSLEEQEQEAQRDQSRSPARKAVQLRRRHWIIRGADKVQTDEVEGAGVIGEFPVLEAGKYCSDMTTA